MSDGYRLDVRTASFGGWTIFFVLVTIGTVAFILATPAGSSTSTAVSAGLVVVLQVAYWLVARPQLAGIRADGTRAWVFAGTAVVLFTVAAVLNPWAALLLFALTPEIFLLLTPRPATVVIIALNVLPLVVRLITQPYGLRDAISDVGTTAFVITFSLFFASRILSISKQNEERRRLIEQLREREAEVAALSAARGAEQERARIAREMHDTLAQGFASIVTLGHAVQGELERDPAGARRPVELITETARDNLAESRRIIAAMGPARLEGASLAEAVQRVVDTWQQTTGIDVRLQISGVAGIGSRATDVVALRVIQESLENIRKHAGAHRVDVALGAHGDGLVVEIGDDGRGFDHTRAPSGYGLAGMRSRVIESGGQFNLTSHPGAGTTVRVQLPTGGTS